VPGSSNYNILLILDQLGRPELDALSKPAYRWARAGNRPPLLFTPEQFAAASDVFVIELLDMQQSRRVLCGDDPLAGVTIQEEHLRLQLERELRTRLLAVREGYLLTAGKPRFVADLMTGSLPGFLVLFRAALRLFQKDVPPHKIESLKKLAEHVRFDPGPLLEIDALRHRRVKLRDISPLGLFESYLATVEQITLAVDRHLHPEKGSVSP
jgi:hypothetical protein